MQQLSASQRGAADPAALAARLAERTKRLRQRVTADGPTEAPLCFLAFNSGHERYGIPLADIVEIQALEQFSPVPKTPPFIAGVVHWRGAVLALLDLGKLLEGPQAGLPDYHVSIIVQTAGTQIAIIAREVEDILSLPREQIKPAPHSTGSTPAEWVLGVHDENRLLLNMNQILRDAKLVSWKK
jgi:purine-binding chemotaxis protein CheW